MISRQANIFKVMLLIFLFICSYSLLVNREINKSAFYLNEIVKKPSLDNTIEIKLSRQNYFLTLKHVIVDSQEEFFINDTKVKSQFLREKGIIKSIRIFLPKALAKDGTNKIGIKFSSKTPPDIDLRISNFRKRLSNDMFIFLNDINSLDYHSVAQAIFLFIVFYGGVFILIRILFSVPRQNIFNLYLLSVFPVTFILSAMAFLPRFAGYCIVITPFIFWLILISVTSVILLFSIFLKISYMRMLQGPKIKNVGAGLILSLLGIVLLFGSCEIITRIYAHRYYKDRIFKLEDLNLSYRLRPNVKGLFAGAQIECNSLGLRDDKRRSYNKGPGLTRIICIGDSITFGYGVANNETYPYFLDDILNQQHKDGYEVINCGIVAYNTYQERLFLERYGIKFNPDIIIVGVCLNDIGGGVLLPSNIVNTFIAPLYTGSTYKLYRYKDMPLTCKTQFVILRHSYFAQYIFLKFKTLCSRWKWFSRPMVGDYAKASLDYYGGDFNDEIKKEESIFEEEALLIKKIADRNNAKLILVLFPNDIQLDRENLRIPQQIIGDFCKKNNIHFLDLLPTFKIYKKDNIFTDIGHPNSMGNKIVAEVISEFIRKIQ